MKLSERYVSHWVDWNGSEHYEVLDNDIEFSKLSKDEGGTKCLMFFNLFPAKGRYGEHCKIASTETKSDAIRRVQSCWRIPYRT